MRTYNYIRKLATGQGDDYTTGCFLDHNYFNKYHKMTVIDLSKQPDPKAIPQIKFTRNLERDKGATMFFIIEEPKEAILDFSQRTEEVL